jgi:hypothetical protein
MKPDDQAGDQEKSVEQDDDRDEVPTQREEEPRHPTLSPPNTPSTVADPLPNDAGDGADDAQESMLTRIRSTNDSRRSRPPQSPRDDLSDGTGSVYSEMSIG